MDLVCPACGSDDIELVEEPNLFECECGHEWRELEEPEYDRLDLAA